MTNSGAISDAGWDPAFWFAVLSPIIGVLIAVLALTVIYHL